MNCALKAILLATPAVLGAPLLAAGVPATQSSTQREPPLVVNISEGSGQNVAFHLQLPHFAENKLSDPNELLIVPQGWNNGQNRVIIVAGVRF